MYVDLARRHALLSTIGPLGLPHRTMGFRGARFRSPSLTALTLHHVLTNQSTSRRTGQRLATTYPDASSTDAMNGLSYPAISSACAHEYRVIQVSPHTPASLPTPQQPTAWDIVRPSRAARCRDFHPFAHDRVIPVTWQPVSVSPNVILHACFSGLGRRGEFHSPAPCVTWRAPLRAPRFSGHFQAIGCRLKMKCTNVSGVGGPSTFNRVCGPPTLPRIA